MFGLGATEILIIAVIVLLIFGAKRIPEIGKGIGGAFREVKKIKKDMKSTPSKKTEEGKEPETEEEEPGLLSDGIKKHMLNQVPVAKKAMEFNDKVKKVNEILK